MSKYTSVTPKKMSKEELHRICGELFTAKSWGLKYITAHVVGGTKAIIPTSDLKNYQSVSSVITGGLRS